MQRRRAVSVPAGLADQVAVPVVFVFHLRDAADSHRLAIFVQVPIPDDPLFAVIFPLNRDDPVRVRPDLPVFPVAGFPDDIPVLIIFPVDPAVAAAEQRRRPVDPEPLLADPLLVFVIDHPVLGPVIRRQRPPAVPVQEDLEIQIPVFVVSLLHLRDVLHGHGRPVGVGIPVPDHPLVFVVFPLDGDDPARVGPDLPVRAVVGLPADVPVFVIRPVDPAVALPEQRRRPVGPEPLLADPLLVFVVGHPVLGPSVRMQGLLPVSVQEDLRRKVPLRVPLLAHLRDSADRDRRFLRVQIPEPGHPLVFVVCGLPDAPSLFAEDALSVPVHPFFPGHIPVFVVCEGFLRRPVDLDGLPLRVAVPDPGHPPVRVPCPLDQGISLRVVDGLQLRVQVFLPHSLPVLVVFQDVPRESVLPDIKGPVLQRVFLPHQPVPVHICLIKLPVLRHSTAAGRQDPRSDQSHQNLLHRLTPSSLEKRTVGIPWGRFLRWDTVGTVPPVYPRGIPAEPSPRCPTLAVSRTDCPRGTTLRPCGVPD